MTPDDETARQRKAAELALDQLNWCVSYFRSIRKTKIASQLARNVDEIRRRLREGGGEDDRQA